MKPSSLFVLFPALVLAALFSVANRQAVTVRLDPFDGSETGLSFAVPLYVVVFAALLAGAVLGGLSARLSQRRGREKHPGAADIGAAIAGSDTQEHG